MIIETNHHSLSLFSFLLANEKLTQSINEFTDMFVDLIHHCEQIQYPQTVEYLQEILIEHTKQKCRLEEELHRIKTSFLQRYLSQAQEKERKKYT